MWQILKKKEVLLLQLAYQYVEENLYKFMYEEEESSFERTKSEVMN